jgi:preprotein translocase subunit SecB
MIGPVDFYAMYQDQLRENAAQPANAATPTDPAPGGGANA